MRTNIRKVELFHKVPVQMRILQDQEVGIINSQNMQVRNQKS